MRHYYNSTDQTGQTLMNFEMKAKNQDEAVLWVFERPTIATLTPEMCLTYLKAYDKERFGKVPITSIRRSFSNLYNSGIIEKTGNYTKGEYGRDVNSWKLSK